MDGAKDRKHYSFDEMDEPLFREMSAFIYSHCRIKLPPIKRTMLSSRISKRLKATGFPDYSAYFNHVKKLPDDHPELLSMIDAVTTNKTDFFREEAHFEYLSDVILPEFKGKEIRIWSAGCSSGEEVYTLAVVLEEYNRTHSPIPYSIMGSDISLDILRAAKSAVYTERDIEPIAEEMRKRYLLKGTGPKSGLYRIAPELRKHITFFRVNLTRDEEFPPEGSFDVIFCRNVVIYFDRDTQTSLFRNFYSRLVFGGYLFTGHSETLHGINDEFVPVEISVYRKVPPGMKVARFSRKSSRP